jgi:hypothetical protein
VKFVKFSKEVAIINSIIILIIVFLILGIITFRAPCGQNSMIFEYQNKPCICVGTTEENETDYGFQSYCTGFNLSQNRVISLFEKKQTQEIVKLYKLRVKVSTLTHKIPVTKGHVLVSTKSGKQLILLPLKDSATAIFELPENSYVISMSSGYTGYQLVNLDKDMDVLLEVIPIYE